MQGGDKHCVTCGKALSRRNRSGYCTSHVSAANAAKPEWREKQRAGVRRALHLNPERLAAHRRHLAEYGRNPEVIERKRQRAKDIGLSKLGQAHLSRHPELLAMRGKKQSDSKLAWCPREARDQYKRLVRSKKIPAAEARVMILEQHERDMAAFRRKLEAA